MISITIFMCGLLLGSFFNVVGLRVPVKKSIAKPRSSCPECKHVLKAYELVPVFSYLLQGRKCRRCGRRISILYPAGELATALLFTVSYWKFGWTPELVIAWGLISLVIIIFISDIVYMLIPDKVLLFFGSLFIVLRIIWPLNPWWDSLVGAASGFSLLLLLAIVSKGGMGGGDIKLYAVLGLVLGTKLALMSFFVATLLGGILGGIAMLAGILKKGNPIPFGPFIGAAILIVYFYHEELTEWYLSFLQT